MKGGPCSVSGKLVKDIQEARIFCPALILVFSPQSLKPFVTSAPITIIYANCTQGSSLLF